MRRINREELLQSLEDVQAGLSVRDILEQSSCFVLDGGRIMTFNDEVACSAPLALGKGVKGAVQAKPLLALLRKLPDDELQVAVGEGELVLQGKGRKAGIVMESEVMLPLDQLEQPGDWSPLHDDFMDALSMVQECAGKDVSLFATVCVHLHPKWMEACDNHQMIRFKLKTGVAAPALVKRDSLKPVLQLGVTEVSETAAWVHFRNSKGLIFSCRRYEEEFPDLKPFLAEDGGRKTNLPKGLGQELDCCEVFSGENADNNHVVVELMPGKLRVKGTGVTGWYRATKGIKYEGPPMTFLIAPRLLRDITARHNDCSVSATRLRVDGGRWVYTACLGTPEEEK